MILPYVQTFLSVLLLVFFVGCHTPLAVKQIQAKNPLAKNTAKTPIKVVDMWNSCAQTTADGKMVRGMAGRVHFYDNPRESQAVKVEGDLTVYVFNGSEMDPIHTKPLKIFQFKAETLDEHYAYQKPLGHGYNFFLPIDDIGGEEKPLSIVTRFNDRLQEGTYVMSPLVNTMLVGRKPQLPTDPTVREFLESRSVLAEAQQRMTTPHDSAIQQTGFVTEREERTPASTRVSTIPLNSHLTQRLLKTTTSGSAAAE